MEWIIDIDGEDFVFENEWDTVIPVSFEDIDGLLRVSVFPSVEKEVRDHFALHEADPFSDKALSHLWETLAPFMQKWGYADDKFRDRWGYILQISPKTPLKFSPFSDTRVLVSEDEDINQTTFDIEMSIEDGLLGYGTEREGEIVSLAMTHTPPDESIVVEVGVETIPSARCQGLAKSNLSALCHALQSMGKTIEYRCQRYNEGSKKTAEGVGMTVVGKYYHYVGRKCEHGL